MMCDVCAIAWPTYLFLRHVGGGACAHGDKDRDPLGLGQPAEQVAVDVHGLAGAGWPDQQQRLVGAQAEVQQEGDLRDAQQRDAADGTASFGSKDGF